MAKEALGPVPSLRHTDAAEWNKTILKNIQDELVTNPNADLMCLFPERYLDSHRHARLDALDYLEQKNLRVLYDLEDEIKQKPLVNLFQEIPKDYYRKIAENLTKEKAKDISYELKRPERDWRNSLDWARTAKIIYPLSEVVTAAIERFKEDVSEDEDDEVSDGEDDDLPSYASENIPAVENKTSIDHEHKKVSEGDVPSDTSYDKVSKDEIPSDTSYDKVSKDEIPSDSSYDKVSNDEIPSDPNYQKTSNDEIPSDPNEELPSCISSGSSTTPDDEIFSKAGSDCSSAPTDHSEKPSNNSDDECLSEASSDHSTASSEEYDQSDDPNGEELATALKKLIWASPKIWEAMHRGVVIQCCEGIVAKIVCGSEKDTTEYTSMQFLAEKAPEVPAPRVHGLIMLGCFSVLFMTQIPGITLEKAWGSFDYQEKKSIQKQLEGTFLQLRSLKPDQEEIGGVGGEGAKESKINGALMFKGIKTPKEYSDLGFTACTQASNTYVEFLKIFREKHCSMKKKELVFSHGDVRPANIMVSKDPITGKHTITGIIDWGESGFYPAYYESTHITRRLFATEDDDWYLFVPESISPAKSAVHWLVDRVWGFIAREY